MTEPVSLEEIKRHLRLESDDTADDSDLVGLILAARRACEQRINLKIGDLDADDLAVLRQAMKLVVGHWYQNRESVAVGTISTIMPNSAMWLLDPLTSFANR